MSKQEQLQNETESIIDGSHLSEERKLEIADMNARLTLERCQHKGIQPRELLLKAFQDSKRSDDATIELIKIVSAMPDYNLNELTEFARAKDDIKNLYSKISDLHQQDEGEREMRSKWTKAGIFSYEFGEKNELILHIPPMIESPKLGQLKDSLKKLAQVLKQNPDIPEVKGSSLLLEHPIAKRLGFEIDTKSDNKLGPSFHMSREEFLKRFGN